MTKEEYHRLLNSDYWKGFSYSIIKERNFTCEDCGRRFYNQRNKLQVHHLVYRDINPWSYKPEEMVVLCEECHKKRHNILSGATLETVSLASDNETLNNNFSYSSDSRDVRGGYIYSNKRKEADRWDVKPDNRWEPERRFKKKYVLYGLLLFVAIYFGISKMIVMSTDMEKDKNDVPTVSASEIANDEMAVPEDLNVPKDGVGKSEKIGDVRSKEGKKRDGKRDENKDDKIPEVTLPEIPRSTSVNNKSERELYTLELLERKNHADVVKRARRAGVSAEGSTMEILERINHADVVKRARRAGVSAEGSTMEILERINHADVVKRAQRAGVSAEGSTIDILERINRKELENREY